jgi:hypothetical protein
MYAALVRRLAASQAQGASSASSLSRTQFYLQRLGANRSAAAIIVPPLVPVANNAAAGSAAD